MSKILFHPFSRHIKSLLGMGLTTLTGGQLASIRISQYCLPSPSNNTFLVIKMFLYWNKEYFCSLSQTFWDFWDFCMYLLSTEAMNDCHLLIWSSYLTLLSHYRHNHPFKLVERRTHHHHPLLHRHHHSHDRSWLSEGVTVSSRSVLEAVQHIEQLLWSTSPSFTFLSKIITIII